MAINRGTIRANILGVDEALLKLGSLMLTVKGTSMRRALHAGAVVIRDEARRQAPRRTGSLAKSIISGSYKSKSKKARVDPYYAVVKIAKAAYARNDKGKLKRQKRGVLPDGKKAKAYKRGDIYPRNYDHLVEFGTKPHDLNKNKPGAKPKLHPGSKPKPFMRSAAFAKSAEASVAIAAKLRADVLGVAAGRSRKVA